MIPDISRDVKEFLLSYFKIHQLTQLAKGELLNIHMALEAEIARQEWFIGTSFKVKHSHNFVQVWKRKWHPSEIPGCPWIHLECVFSWQDRWVQASLDLESARVVPRTEIKQVASRLSASLFQNTPASLKTEGWILSPELEGDRMLLVKRNDVLVEAFSADWLFQTGKQLISELSDVIPYVDQTVKDLFGPQS